MRIARQVLAVALCVGVLAAPMSAQESPGIVQPDMLDQALAERVDHERADRARIERVLELPEVREVAGQLGLSLERARAAVATVDGAELQEIAAQAEQVEQALAGGADRVVITTTGLILILLALILLILIIR